MQKAKNRIVLDTNLWISFLLTKELSKLDKILADKKVLLLFSEELLEELVEVMSRSKFSKYFTTSDTEHLLLLILERSIFIEVISKVEMCRDPKDNFLLSLCVDGNASHLITGDKDLLVLGKIGKTQIISIKEYLNKL